MVGVYANEATPSGVSAPTLLERGQDLRNYYRRRPGGLDVEFVRNEAAEDPAALLVGLALDMPRRARRTLTRPAATWLVLACCVVCSRR